MLPVRVMQIQIEALAYDNPIKPIVQDALAEFFELADSSDQDNVYVCKNGTKIKTSHFRRDDISSDVIEIDRGQLKIANQEQSNALRRKYQKGD